jgi:hypothetical protein
MYSVGLSDVYYSNLGYVFLHDPFHFYTPGETCMSRDYVQSVLSQADNIFHIAYVICQAFPALLIGIKFDVFQYLLH